MIGASGRAPGGTPVSDASRHRLEVFAQLVERWNPTIRLVSSRDISDLWSRHIDDALQLRPMIAAQTTHAVDLGSGGGFPGLVLAIATGIHFDLIESDSRKAAFLREAAIATDARVTIHTKRIQDVDVPPRDLVTARALAPLAHLLELAAPMLAVGGTCLFPKGERADDELLAAKKVWTMSLRQVPSRTSPSATIFCISDLRRHSETNT